MFKSVDIVFSILFFIKQFPKQPVAILSYKLKPLKRLNIKFNAQSNRFA